MLAFYMANKGLAGILEKILIGTSLVFGGSYISGTDNYAYSQNTMTSQQRQDLENMTMLQGALGSLLHSGIIPVKTPEDARIMHGLGDLNLTLSRINEYHLRNESLRYLGDAIGGNTGRNNSGNAGNNSEGNNSTIRTDPYAKSLNFLANHWSDDDKDGKIKWSEIKGYGKRVFDRHKDEKILFGMFVSGNVKDKYGKSGEIKIFSPARKEAISRKLRFQFNGNEWRWTGISSKEWMDYYGPGTYAVAFYFDNKFWEAMSFEIFDSAGTNRQPLSRAIICNYARDLNNDGYIGYDEFAGIDKKSFRKNESIAFGFYLNSAGIQGKEVKIKIINPKGEEFAKIENVFSGDFQNFFRKFDVEEIFNKHGLGTYTAAYYYNNFLYSVKIFDIVE
jgi:hypothetical protein